MAAFQIPPWLNVGPTDYLRAIQAGTQSGLEVARTRAAMQEAAARRMQAQQEAAQRAWEFGETMRQRAAQQEAEREMERAKLEQSKAYQAGLLDWHNEQARIAADKAAQAAAHQADLLGLRGENLDLATKRYEETARHNAELEDLRRATIEGKTRPEDYYTETQTTPAVPGTPGIPAVPAEKQSLFGIDMLWPDKPAIPEVPAVPGIPSRTITRKIPINPAAGTTSIESGLDPRVAAYEAQIAKESGTANEVIRYTKDGRRAVFNADTKEFIRYAD